MAAEDDDDAACTLRAASAGAAGPTGVSGGACAPLVGGTVDFRARDPAEKKPPNRPPPPEELVVLWGGAAAGEAALPAGTRGGVPITTAPSPAGEDMVPMPLPRVRRADSRQATAWRASMSGAKARPHTPQGMAAVPGAGAACGAAAAAADGAAATGAPELPVDDRECASAALEALSFRPTCAASLATVPFFTSAMTTSAVNDSGDPIEPDASLRDSTTGSRCMRGAAVEGSGEPRSPKTRPLRSAAASPGVDTPEYAESGTKPRCPAASMA